MLPQPKPPIAMKWVGHRGTQANQPPAIPSQNQHPAHLGVAQEHAVLLRHMGRLQTSVSALLADKEARLQALGGEVLRLRGQLLVARTAVLWGLALRTEAAASHQPTARFKNGNGLGASQLEDPERSTAARQLVCQTGCVGHAHHWLTAGGTCQLSGQACERQAMEKSLGSTALPQE